MKAYFRVMEARSSWLLSKSDFRLSNPLRREISSDNARDENKFVSLAGEAAEGIELRNKIEISIIIPDSETFFFPVCPFLLTTLELNPSPHDK